MNAKKQRKNKLRRYYSKQREKNTCVQGVRITLLCNCSNSKTTGVLCYPVCPISLKIVHFGAFGR